VGGVEDGIPHFFADEALIDELMRGFRVNRLSHIYTMKTKLYNGSGVHWFIEADAEKVLVEPDFSGVIGKTVSGMG
jgi:ribosomal protein L21E